MISPFLNFIFVGNLIVWANLNTNIFLINILRKKKGRLLLKDIDELKKLYLI